MKTFTRKRFPQSIEEALLQLAPPHLQHFAFAALYSAFGKHDVVHIHAEGQAFFCWLPKLFGKRVVVTIHGECEIIWTTREKPDFMRVYAA